MSVVKAILFYSKYDKKSYKMKKTIDNIGIDIDTVCADNLEIRERLLDDTQYCIDQVPSVLLLYSSGQHKVYKKKGLDEWFQQLLQNIEQYNQSQQQQPVPQEFTPISEPLMQPPQQPDFGESGMGGSGAVSASQAAMISEHIKGSEPTVPITSDPYVKKSRKEVTKEGPSAAELAKQMAEQREHIEEELEENRPFI